MTNVLIAIVSNSFQKIERARRSIDTMLKIDLILQAIDLQILLRRFFKHKRKDDILKKSAKM